jgi:WD40 repeat protein
MKYVFYSLVSICWLLMFPFRGLTSELVIATFKGHKHTITCLAFSSDGKTLASGSKDGSVILWDVATGKTQTTFPGHKDMVGAVDFTPDGKDAGVL